MTGVDIDGALQRAKENVERPTAIDIVRADTITPEQVKWLWPTWLARGKFHIIGGAPGTGKTTLAIAVAATITSDGLFPDGLRASIGSVLMWSGEDDHADSIVPRFLANGGDTTRLHLVNGGKDAAGKSRPFDPATDFQALAEAARNIPDLKLLIVDPVVSAVPGDSHKNAEVRRALQPLADFASDTGAAVLGVTHFTKGTTGRDPVERITGSLAFGALPRLVWVTAKPIEQGGARRLVRAKSNIGPDGGGFEYDLQQVRLPGDAEIYGQAIAWEKALDGTARDLLAEVESPNDEADAPARVDCERWLKGLLADGPFDAKEIRRLAELTERKWRTVNRAKGVLKIESIKITMGGGWFWQLPKSAAEDCHTRSVASFGKTGGFAEECHAKRVASFGRNGPLGDGEVEVEI